MKKNTRSMWLSAIALGVSAAVFPAAATFAQVVTAPQKLAKDAVPAPVQNGMHTLAKNAAEISYYRWDQGGTTYYVAQYRKGSAEGKHEEVLFTGDGQTVKGPVQSTDFAQLTPPVGVAPAVTPAVTPAGMGDATSIRAQIASYQQAIQSEKVEADRERERSRTTAESVRAGTLAPAQLATLEQQGAVREQQATARARESDALAADATARAAAPGQTPELRDLYTELARQATERSRQAYETARLASATQTDMDAAELASSTASGALPPGSTLRKIDARDLPAAVRTTFDRQTSGTDVQGYFVNTQAGRNYYSVHYTPRGSQQMYVRASDTGQIIRGPLAIESAGGAAPVGTATGSTDLGQRVAGAELPAKVRQTIDDKTAGGANHYFFRQERDNRTTYRVYYKAADGKWMTTRIGSGGELIDGPVVTNSLPTEVRSANDFPRDAGQPAPLPSTPAPAAPAGERVAGNDLPKAVRDSITKQTTGAKNLEFYREGSGNKAAYNVVFVNKDGRRESMRVSNSGDVLSGPTPSR